VEAPLPAPAMRWLSDVLLAAHAERLGRTMVDMIAGSITLRPIPPAYFAFAKHADGGWTPCMLRPDAEGAQGDLGSGWRQRTTTIMCTSRVQARDFACQAGGFPASVAYELPVEAGLVGWLGAQGYKAEAESVYLQEARTTPRIMRVTW
jgi:hypothetical protein